MAIIDVKWNPTARELRRLAWIWLPLCFALIGAYFGYRRGSWGPALSIWAPGLLLCVAGGIAPRFLRAIYRAWMWLVYPIGWLVSHLAMAILFYLVVTPIGLGLRCIGRRPLALAFDRSRPSYWEPYILNPSLSEYFRQS